MVFLARAGRMARSGPIRLALALVLTAGALGLAQPPIIIAASPWTGGMNLYESGVFTTQKSWLWCTAADIQIIRNIVRDTRDHSTSGQRRFFEWMRDHNRYDLPLSAGVDPQGWAAGLRHFVDDRYRLVASTSFDKALRLAVIRLRKTGLPVGVTVSHGNHAWIITGFRATADPLATTDFRVTSVRVTGPLYGLQSKNGYDMAPNTKLSVAQFRRFFTPWHYAPKPMIWDGRYVSIQPVTSGKASAATGAARAAAPRLNDPAVASVGLIGALIAVDLRRLGVERASGRRRRRPCTASPAATRPRMLAGHA